MELNNFIKMKEPWAYNFEFECDDENYKKLETFMRYFIYKTQADVPALQLKNTAEFIKKNFGYRPVYDPDGSNKSAYYQIVIEIYKHLWNWQRENDFAEVDKNIFDNCLFGPDTMNSVQNALNLAVGANSLYKFVNKYYSCKNNDVDELGIKKDIKIKDIYAEKIWKEIVQYIDWYHTLGNFVLVPAGFNNWRGRRNEIKDFWDLSLNYLKENGTKINVKGIFDKSKFNEYINYFFLWDYVEHKDCDYIFKNISHNPCESGQSQFSLDFFGETRKIIERRGRFMIAMLMLEQDLYKELQEWLVTKNDNGKLPFFDGVNDAAGKILDKFDDIPENAKKILEEI